MLRFIPNALTLFNLFCGCGAIISVLSGQFITAWWFFFASGIADFFDGFAARWLSVSGPLGKELDSLADMVSFGVVPGVILYALFVLGPTGTPAPVLDGTIVWTALPVFLVSVFSGLRLAKFNLDERQTEDFIGLATPSSTLFVVGMMLIYQFDSFGWRSLVANPYVIYAVAIVLSGLLVSEIYMFSLKFKGGSDPRNTIRYIFAAIAALLFIFLREAAFTPLILIYIILNLLFFKKVTAS